MHPSTITIEKNIPHRKRYEFKDIVYPNGYEFDFENLLPSSCILKVESNSADTDYQINRATKASKAGENESKHTDKAVVCKHWLRGLCKKGELCEFLHEYNLKRIPECWFYTKYGECSNPECMYLHLDPGSKFKYCPLYNQGFCPEGPSCQNRHLKRAVCKSYLLGFCLNGPKCNLAHPKCTKPEPEAPTKSVQSYMDFLVQDNFQKLHQAPCYPYNTESVDKYNFIPPSDSTQGKIYRPLETVTCFKCGMKGHYANRCVKRARMYPSEITASMREVI